jgi:CheY-like chemotaxis protein
MATHSILLLCDDLLFSSRIAGTARSLGIALRTARNTQALDALVEQEAPACVIVDLSNPGLDIVTLLTALKQLTTPPRVVAFGSHVDAATLKAARDAGCDPVWPRSKFVEELEQALPGWLTPTST